LNEATLLANRGGEFENQDGDYQDQIEPEHEKGKADRSGHLDFRLLIFPCDVNEWLSLIAEPNP